MTIRQRITRLLFLALALGAGASALAAISDPLPEDQTEGARTNASAPSNWSEPATTVVEVTIPPATPVAATERALSANPLWAMPLKQFSATRERPIFSPSRQPPAPAAAVVETPKIIALPKPKEPEQPQLSLVGTIAGDDAKFGIFLDQSTKAVIRLKIGDDFQGWKLQSVRAKETSLEKNQRTVVVAMPQPSSPSVTLRSEFAPIGGDSGKLMPINSRPRSER